MSSSQSERLAAPVARRRTRYLARYISEDGAKNLRAYRYKGCDSSLMLKYITNPIYNRIVLLFPLWLAPNVITLAGLICSLISYCIMMSYCPFLDGPAPRWAYVVQAIALLAYQALDAMDGKQARRTGSSSALGMLFDHGCDALNATVSSLSICAAFQLGAGCVSYVFWLATTIVFYWATIEEFYTGELRLGSINGPNEGLAIVAGLNILTAIVGPDFWKRDVFGIGIPCNWIFFGSMLFVSICTVAQNAYHIHRAVLNEGGGGLKFLEAFTRPVPYSLLAFLGFTWVQCSPTNVMSRHPVLLIWSLGLLFSKIVTQLMLNHVCQDEYHPIGKTMSMMGILLVHLAVHSVLELAHRVGVLRIDTFINSQGSLLIWNEDLMLWELIFISACSYIHFVFQGMSEVREILGLSCFTISPPGKLSRENTGESLSTAANQRSS